MEKTEALKSKIKAALFYPAAVIIVAGIVVTILMIFVIPQFSELFANFGADLPALTQLLIEMSDFFVKWWWAMFIVAGGSVFGIMELHKRSRPFAQGMERLMLKLPVLGVVLEKAAIARFARTLETMFAAGTPLVEAMTSVAGACGNIVFYDACLKIRDDISTGTQLQASMRDTGLFPNMVVQMVAIGEESGSIDTMLGKVADWYEQEVDDAVEALTSLLEPAIMAFLGVVIGGIVIGMYLPIFKMGQVV
jgi:type IV pilus assembly protein PilC